MRTRRQRTMKPSSSSETSSSESMSDVSSEVDSDADSAMSSSSSSSSVAAAAVAVKFETSDSSSDDESIDNESGVHNEMMPDDDNTREIVSRLASNTGKMLRWAVGVFNSWRHASNKSIRDGTAQGKPMPETPIQELNDEDLSSQLASFFVNVRCSNGQKYKARTLTQISAFIQRFLNEHGRPVNLRKDEAMKPVVDAIDLVVREAGEVPAKMSSNRQTKAMPMKIFDECWTSGKIGLHAPEPMFRAFVFLLSYRCGLKGAVEHRDLKFSDFKISNRDGRKCLSVTVPRKKHSSNHGRHPVPTKPKVVDVFEDTERPDRCLVRLYEKYVKVVPKRERDEPYPHFYLSPLPDAAKGTYWFTKRPIGVNKIARVVKEVTESLGYHGYSNHSLRATAAATLAEAGFSDQSIQSHTGHTSTKIRQYVEEASETRMEQSRALARALNSQQNGGGQLSSSSYGSDGEHGNDNNHSNNFPPVVENNNAQREEQQAEAPFTLNADGSTTLTIKITIPPHLHGSNVLVTIKPS